MNFPDYYAVLGLPGFYPTQEEIRDAFLNKVAELNASGPANPDARQEIDSAYLTLSDAKKKREYDEVLDRYVQAEENSENREFHAKTAVLKYDWHSPDKSRRRWSVDPESDKVYDFLFAKAEQLNQIIHRYPFEEEIQSDFYSVIERGMLILYNCFFDVYSKNYTEDRIKAIIADGLLLLTLYPPVKDDYFFANYSEKKNQQIWRKFDVIADGLFKAAQLAAEEGGGLFNFFAAVYLARIFNMNALFQKIKSPDSQEAYQSMKREVSDLLESFYNKKEPVT